MGKDFKVTSNFSAKQKQIKKYADKLSKHILRDAVALAMQEVANVSAMDFFRPTSSVVEAITLRPLPSKLTSRSNRLVGSVMGTFRFSDVRLPASVKSLLDKGITSSSKDFGEGKTESIREIKISGSKIQGIIGSKTPYARIQELGGTVNHSNLFGRGIKASIKIPKRPFLNPAVKSSKKVVIAMFRESVEASFKAEKI
jgi:hypothetical protein